MTIPLYSLSIMGHPSRIDMMQWVIERIPGWLPYEAIIDEESQGIWGTAMRAWSTYSINAPYHLVLQDDIYFHNDFFDWVQDLLLHKLKVSDRKIRLSFCDNLRGMEHINNIGNRHWLRTNACRHAQAILQHRDLIGDWIDWSENSVRSEYYHDDGRLDMYMKVHNEFIYHAIPSPVQHRDEWNVDNYKLTGEKSKSRDIDYISHTFKGIDISPFDYDYTLTDNELMWRLDMLSPEQRFSIGFYDDIVEVTQGIVNPRIINAKAMSLTYSEAIKRDRSHREVEL